MAYSDVRANFRLEFDEARFVFAALFGFLLLQSLLEFNIRIEKREEQTA